MKSSKLNRKIMMIIIFAFLIFLLPNALTKSPETSSVALITTVGIDKEDDDIIISAHTIIPKISGGVNQTIKTISAKGKTIELAFDKLSAYLGKEIGIDTCNAIILGKEFCKENVAEQMDFFFRGNQVEHNTLLAYFDGNAKDLIEATEQISKDYSVNLDDLIKNNNKNFLLADTTIEEFASEYFTTQAISLLGAISLEEGEYGLKFQQQSGSGQQGGENQESQGGSGEKGQGGSSSGSKSKVMNTIGNTAVFKKGKKILDLDINQTTSLNWFLDMSEKFNFNLDDVNDDLYNNAKLGISLTSKSLKFKCEFKDEKPYLKIDLKTDVVIERLFDNNNDGKYKDITTNFLTDEVKDRIKERINDDLNSILDIVKINKIDIIGVYEKFEKFKHNDLNKYLSSNSEEEFFTDLMVELNVDVTSKKL